MAAFKVLWIISCFITANCLLLAHDCDMTNMTTRRNTCPPDSCCCQDPTQPGEVYCKPISDIGGPCYAAAAEWPASCPCKSPLKCVPNLQVATWTSKYGTCQNITTLK